MKKVFLGGTCNKSTWRDEIIPKLKVDYFNPVVDDWTPECQAEEERQKNCVCDVHLYVITPKMTGVFSIAEVVESAIIRHENCIFCYLEEDEEYMFTDAQDKSLNAVGCLVSKYGAYWARTLENVVDYINSLAEKENALPFRKVDYTEYENTYNKETLQEWKEGKELDIETLRGLIYGCTFTEEYAKGIIADELSMDYWRDKYYESDHDFDIDKPIEGITADELSMDYEVDTPQERLLMEMLDSTGDGKTPETAICVIDVGQEYEYLDRKFPYSCVRMSKQEVRDGIDCLHFDENPFGIERIYFDIKRRFDVGYPCSYKDDECILPDMAFDNEMVDYDD